MHFSNAEMADRGEKPPFILSDYLSLIVIVWIVPRPSLYVFLLLLMLFTTVI